MTHSRVYIRIILYSIDLAALKLMARHAFLFKEYLTVSAEKMLKRMEATCNHKNDKVRKAAAPANEAFIGQVAYELVKGKRNEEDNKKTFTFLVSEITQMMDPKHSSKYRFSMAIRSFGNMAAPMKKYLGEKDTKVLLLKLFKLADQLLTK